jgi:fumarylacetoacetase
VHLPIAYHSRASSIVLDGTPITRPRGQTSADGKTPELNITGSMDFELEMGAIIGAPSKQGYPIKIEDARDHIFGFTILNDWSARDIKKMGIRATRLFQFKELCLHNLTLGDHSRSS